MHYLGLPLSVRKPATSALQPLFDKLDAKIQDICWTADRLARRSVPHPRRRVFSDKETKAMPHLLGGCSFARQVWHGVLPWSRAAATIPHPDDEFLDWWASTSSTAPASMHKGVSSLVILTSRSLWKHQK